MKTKHKGESFLPSLLNKTTKKAKNTFDLIYFPDILLYSTNTIIEVKDQYWFDRTFENNILKAKATLSKGFNFEFWILKKENTWEIKKL